VPIVQLPDAEVYVSPDLDIDIELPKVSVAGTVLVPRARLALDELPEQAVRPSSDAVVHGIEQAEAARPLNVTADIRMVLGDDVSYTGSNLNTTLAGDIRVQYTSGRSADASGNLTIAGSYDAYGQSLALDRGELIFTGPLDDPGLDVRAVRTVGSTTVGVQLSGTLKAPETRMFSDPAMSEADALAYLLLGRPLAGSGDEESATVQSAALSMGLQQALPVVQRIGETLGFDEFAIGTDDVAPGALMAGKYLSPKVYIRYSYGLFNRIGGLLLRFRINDYLSIETRSGEQKSMDVLYTIEKN
jgi:translocation and assembly module TamB